MTEPGHESPAAHPSQVGLATLTEMFRTMVLTRRFEERVADLNQSGAIKTPCHFYIGQEAVASGVCAALTRADQVWGAHRSHGHYLAKGGDLDRLMAEMFCKQEGCSGGRGGSMHICDLAAGVVGTVPIVAATIPLAVGGALASKLKKSGQVSVTFFGDGSTEEGHFHESLNIAAIYKLPCLFILENNLYSSHMSLAERRACDGLASFGTMHGMPGVTLDGNDVLAVHDAARQAVDRARRGEGPTLIECITFRHRGHVGPSSDMDVGVKRRDEMSAWLARDPIGRCREALTARGVSGASLGAIEAAVERDLDRAERFAAAGSQPRPATVVRHVYRAA